MFIPKCRRKTLYAELRKHLGEVFRKLAQQKESRIEEGHLMPDHVHMMISIPPKYAVSQVIGFIKGKSAIHLARVSAILWGSISGHEGTSSLDRRSRRSGDTGVHQKPGAGGQPLGPNEFVALISHLQVANKYRAASATLTAASSGPNPKDKPPALPGDTYISRRSSVALLVLTTVFDIVCKAKDIVRYSCRSINAKTR